MQLRHRSLIALTVLPLAALAACGGSTTPTAATGSPPAGGTSATAGGLHLAHPVTLGFLWEVKGESSFAIDDYQQGAMLAVEEINKAGGVGSQQVRTARKPASPIDPQSLTANFLSLTASHPDILIGVPALDIEALTRSIDRAGIPLISQAPDNLTVTGQAAASQWLFTIAPTPTDQATAAARFVVQELGAKKVGLMHTNEPFGQTGSDIQKKVIPTLGARVSAQVGFAPDATDLTTQVLAVKGADAVIDWAYPNPAAVQLNQFVQNGIDIPTVGNEGIETDVTYGLVKGAATKKLYSVGQCNVLDPDRARARTFYDAYKARWGTAPSTFAALTYDSVYLAVAAIRAAGSTDPAAVRDALGAVRYTDGVCSSDYHSAGNVLSREVVVMSYGGPAVTTAKTYDFTGNDGS